MTATEQAQARDYIAQAEVAERLATEVRVQADEATGFRRTAHLDQAKQLDKKAESLRHYAKQLNARHRAWLRAGGELP